jgi:hypothetical protein
MLSLESDAADYSHALLVVRMRSEYLEMPGLALTAWHASRLWSVDEAAAETALHTLVANGFLQRGGDGRFRATRGAGASRA